MSSLPTFFTLDPRDRPLTRARFARIASRLTQIEDTPPVPDELLAYTRAWIDALRHTGTVDDLAPAWRRQLAQETKPAALLAPHGAYQILQAYGRYLPDADFLTGAEMFEHARAYLRAQTAATALTSKATATAQAICAIIRGIFAEGRHAENRVNFADLERSVATCITDWAQAVQQEGPDRARLVALHSFLHHAVLVHEAPAGFWPPLLQEIAAHPELAPLGSDDFAAVLLAAIPRFELLRELAHTWESSEDRRPPQAKALRSLLELHLLVAPSPRSLAADTLAHARPPAFARVAQGAVAALSEARIWPGTDLVPSDRQAWTDALDWFENLAAHAVACEAYRPRVEQNLLTALQDEPDHRGLVELALDLLTVAGELHTAALDPARASALWHRHLVSDLGADPSLPPWGQTAALSRALADLASRPDAPMAVRAALPDFRILAARIDRLAQWPIGKSRQILRVTWTPDATRFPAEEVRAAHRSFAEVVITRLCIERRLAEASPAQRILFTWMAEHDTAPVAWDETVRAIETKVTPPLAQAAHDLGRQLPRFAAALTLRREHAALGQAAAIHSCAELSGYRGSLGSRELTECADENAQVFHQLGGLLISAPDRAGAQLADWWRRTYAPLAVRRSGEIVDVGFEGLHAALLSRCDHAEFEVVLPALHDFYQTAHGMANSPLVLFSECSDQRLRPNFAQRARGVTTAANRLRPALAQRLHSMVGPAAATDFLNWLAAANEELSTASHPEAALARLRRPLATLATRHSPATVTHALIALAAESTRHAPSSRLDVSWRAWSSFALIAIEALEQDALAQALLPDAPAPGRTVRASAAPFGEVHDLGAMNAFLARQLRSHSAPLAVLNTARYLVECITPGLHRPTAGWRDVFSRWHETSLARCPATAQPLLREIATFLDALAPRLSRIHGIAARTFRPGLRQFEGDHATEVASRLTFCLALLWDEQAPANRFVRPDLCVLGWRHGLIEATQVTAMHQRLVAHADRLFDFLEPDDFYWLHDQLVFASHAALATLAAPPAPAEEIVRTAVSLASRQEPRRPLNPFTRLTARRMAALTTEVARATAAAALAGMRSDIAPARLTAILAQIQYATPANLVAPCAEASRVLFTSLEEQPGCARLIAAAKSLGLAHVPAASAAS